MIATFNWYISIWWRKRWILKNLFPQWPEQDVHIKMHLSERKMRAKDKSLQIACRIKMEQKPCFTMNRKMTERLRYQNIYPVFEQHKSTIKTFIYIQLRNKQTNKFCVHGRRRSTITMPENWCMSGCLHFIRIAGLMFQFNLSLLQFRRTIGGLCVCACVFLLLLLLLILRKLWHK